MQDELSLDLPLDLLLDMLVFEDLETANEKLAPFHLKARWVDANRGEVEIVSAFGGRVYRIGPNVAPAQGDLFAPDTIDRADAAGAIITSAMEDSDTEAYIEIPRVRPPLGEITPRYQSTFRGAVKEGEKDWDAQKLEERFRFMLLNPNSTLNKLLRFYAHGIADTSGEIGIPQKPVTEEPKTVESTSDARTVNNVMRHGYRVLTDDEKAKMLAIKDMSLAFWELVDTLGSSRELSNAKTRIEEASMWAIKHLTA